MQHYCFECGTPLEVHWIDNRNREVCPDCGWIRYTQLKVGAAVLIEKQNKLLFLQRNHEPWKGSWMVPAGYVEADEDPRDAARREVLEETGLYVELGALPHVYYFSDVPRGNGVVIVYQAEKISGELLINHESTAANYFAWHEIPTYLTQGGHDQTIREWREKAQQREAENDG
jgi:ADP-ribose pyrophosphatase YjhB (NUDIX family)